MVLGGIFDIRRGGDLDIISCEKDRGRDTETAGGGSPDRKRRISIGITQCLKKNTANISKR